MKAVEIKKSTVPTKATLVTKPIEPIKVALVTKPIETKPSLVKLETVAAVIAITNIEDSPKPEPQIKPIVKEPSKSPDVKKSLIVEKPKETPKQVKIAEA